VLLELQAPGDLPARGLVRLEALGSSSAWFPWALLDAAALPAVAAAAELGVEDLWSAEGRHFASLRPV
jgi:hypothetical protein